MKLTYAPCGRGGRKSGFIWKMIFLLFSNSLVDKSQQVSKSYTWTRTCLSQTVRRGRVRGTTFSGLSIRGHVTYFIHRGPKGIGGLKMAGRCYSAIDRFCTTAQGSSTALTTVAWRAA